jgi:hypothetical protein
MKVTFVTCDERRHLYSADGHRICKCRFIRRVVSEPVTAEHDAPGWTYPFCDQSNKALQRDLLAVRKWDLISYRNTVVTT